MATFHLLVTDAIGNLYVYGHTGIPDTGDTASCSYDGETPSKVRITTPCAIPGYTPPVVWNAGSVTNPTTPRDTWRADIFSTGDVICPAGEADDGPTKAYLPAHFSGDCEQYGPLRLDWDPYPLSAPPPSGHGGEDSTTSTCSAGSGEFKLYKYHTWDDNRDGTGIIRRFAVQQSGDTFPERAWIREINVTDWGTANKLVFGKVGHWMERSGDTLSTTNAVTLNSSSSDQTFSSGVLTMGTTIAEDGFDLDNQNGDPPVVDVSWTCETSTPSAYNVISLPPLYAAHLEDLGVTGVSSPHRVVAYLNTSGSNHFLRVALEGRYHDGWHVPVHAVGGGSYAFDSKFTDNKVHVAGTVSASQQSLDIDFSTFTVGGVDLGTPQWQLSAM